MPPIRAKKKTRPPVDIPTDRQAAHHVLIVDGDATTRQSISETLQAGGKLLVHQATDLAAARMVLDNHPVELLLLDLNLPSGQSLNFLNELNKPYPNLQVILLTADASLHQAVQAMRRGAADLITKPFSSNELLDRVHAALQRHHDHSRKRRRFTQLKTLCRELNHARHDITQQVDILCNELVNAYQELAGQMHHLEITAELRTLINKELDLETLLRVILEFILEKVGPTNAVIFLPSFDTSFTVGGYVNYSCSADSTQFLLQHLADVVAPPLADAFNVVHLTNNQMIHNWIGDDADWLNDYHILGTPCRDDNDILAAIMLFRDHTEPFNKTHADLLESISEVIGSHLAKVVNIHHRSKSLFEEDDDEDWLTA